MLNRLLTIVWYAGWATAGVVALAHIAIRGDLWLTGDSGLHLSSEPWAWLHRVLIVAAFLCSNLVLKRVANLSSCIQRIVIIPCIVVIDQVDYKSSRLLVTVNGWMRLAMLCLS